MENESVFLISDLLENKTEFIPLLSQEDEIKMSEEEIPESLPVLPIRNTVLFPGVVMPLTVNRDKSIALIKESYEKKKLIGVIAQKNEEVEDPEFEHLFDIGTVARILKVLQMPDGSTTAIIQGIKKFKLEEWIQKEPYFVARVGELPKDKKPKNTKAHLALISTLKDLAIQIIQKSPNIPTEATFAIKNIESPFFLVNFIASNLDVGVQEKQHLLELSDFNIRAKKVIEVQYKELQMLEIKNQITHKAKIDIDKQQRDYFLNQQLKTIQEELGGFPGEEDVKELKRKAADQNWKKSVADVFDKELNKLQRLNAQAPEFSVQLNYLDFFVSLPWSKYSEDKLDLKRAEKILDQDHFGLEKIKERILEYLAVIKLKNDLKAPILCLVGPPGVGKTSLGKSIAKAMDRKYVRMSLGGIRDESELRGHRRTYIGALPGRILKNVNKSGTSNPVFVLDEIDKIMGANISGDPQAALLEILDPEQNHAFHDNYLEADYDLSKVMFIATANSLNNIHPALIDRMEIIHLSGYLAEEKIEIAKRHLIPKQLKEHGVKPTQLKFPKKTIRYVIDQYTREAGVRRLEKNIATIIRKKVKSIVNAEDFDANLSAEEIPTLLGVPRHTKDHEVSHKVPGVITGLAWTAVGGEILFIEVSLSKGNGKLNITGNLGDVMKESASIAFAYLKAYADDLGLKATIFQEYNVHIHVPEGATPKDGPSAGITMFAALCSAFTKRLSRDGIAMTGEITLRGKVLPVGGIKEKILAAKRAKIKTVILSKENRKDIEEISEIYIKGLQFEYVDTMLEVVNLALRK